MTGTDLAVLGRTVVHLRPEQVAYRARLRIQGAGLRRFPEAGRRVLSGPDSVGCRGLAGSVPPSGRADPRPMAESCPNCRRARSGCSARYANSGMHPAGTTRMHRGSGASTCITGTGRGDWLRTLTGSPPGRCSLGCAGPGRHQPDSAAAMLGTPTPPPCVPGHGAVFTTILWPGATSNPTSSPGSRPMRDSCAGTWSTTSAATT